MKNFVQTRYGGVLDATGYKGAYGSKLKDLIYQDIKTTQIHTRHLPDRLILTVNQYKSLEDDIEMLDLLSEYGEVSIKKVGRMFKTPMNVMEVEVV